MTPVVRAGGQMARTDRYYPMHAICLRPTSELRRQRCEFDHSPYDDCDNRHDIDGPQECPHQPDLIVELAEQV